MGGSRFADAKAKDHTAIVGEVAYFLGTPAILAVRVAQFLSSLRF
jgi:hypothetical protein